jgi:hypothetical protein
MKRALIYGSAMASFCVEEFGPERLFKLQESDLENRLQAFKKLTQFEL